MSSASARSSTLTCKKRPRLGVERGFPQLVGVHFAQALVALQGQTLFALGQDGFQQVDRAMDQLVAVLADQTGGVA